MANLLRTLLLIMVCGISLTILTAMDLITLKFNHIQLAIPAFMLTIFVEAFVMFYFIGVGRLAKNVQVCLHSQENLHELFDDPPEDLAPYKKKVDQFVYDSTVWKRQTIPWTMLMLILGMIAFLLGGAHHTGMVRQTTHAGVVYGFSAAMLIGFFKQWKYLGKGHIMLRKLKALFQIPDASM